MFALLAPTVLFLGAVMAQGTPSVVTFQSIPSVPTTEGVFTIQTSVPGGVTSMVSEGSMAIPPGETPIPSSLLSSGLLISTPAGTMPSPTPIGLPSPIGISPSGNTTSGTSPSASSSGTPPPQQSTGAAPSLRLQSHAPFTLALAVSGLAFVGATFILI